MGGWRCGLLALLATACGQDAAGVRAEPDGGLRVDCDQRGSLIELDAQVAANAGADRLRYPMVLAHGFAGFDRVGPLEYFRGVPAALRAAGIPVYVTAVEPMASTDRTRGPELGAQLACIASRSGAGRVNLIGHSQGGLDARWVASHPDHGHWIASVTTIATPHRGTSIADISLGLLPGMSDDLMDSLAELYGQAAQAPEAEARVREAMEQMAVASMPAWNARHPDNPAIPYFSWAGRAVGSAFDTDLAESACAGSVLPNPRSLDRINPVLQVPFELLEEAEGPNDGLVSVTSARWGTFMGCVPADHLDQVGLFFEEGNPLSGFDQRAFFIEVAGSLEARDL